MYSFYVCNLTLDGVLLFSADKNTVFLNNNIPLYWANTIFNGNYVTSPCFLFFP